MNGLSLIICTCNRSILLPKVVAALDRGDPVPGGFSCEVIVVDNNSTDDTAAVVTELSRKKRPWDLRYVAEKKPGLSNARNAGIKAARFDIIGFIDDDAVPRDNYLRNIAAAIVENPGVSCFTNRIIIEHAGAPSWLKAGGKFAVMDRGGYDLGRSKLLEAGDPSPIGASMFFHKSVFERYGGFDPGFGYDFARRDMIVPGEESLLYEKVRRNLTVLYVHEAVVDHVPTGHKYETGYLRRFYKGIGYWYGTRDAERARTDRVVLWGRYPRSYYKRFGRAAVLYLLSRFHLSKAARQYHLFYLYETIGYFIGFRTKT